MRQISLREANQHFSSCIAEVEAGEHLVLTRRGAPIAQIVPYAQKPPRDLAHEQAVRALRSIMRKKTNLGGLRIDREELYDRGR